MDLNIDGCGNILGSILFLFYSCRNFLSFQCMCISLFPYVINLLFFYNTKLLPFSVIKKLTF